jgi:hypothetical protein
MPLYELKIKLEHRPPAPLQMQNIETWTAGMMLLIDGCRYIFRRISCAKIFLESSSK